MTRTFSSRSTRTDRVPVTEPTLPIIAPANPIPWGYDIAEQNVTDLPVLTEMMESRNIRRDQSDHEEGSQLDAAAPPSLIIEML